MDTTVSVLGAKKFGNGYAKTNTRMMIKIVKYFL